MPEPIAWAPAPVWPSSRNLEQSKYFITLNSGLTQSAGSLLWLLAAWDRETALRRIPAWDKLNSTLVNKLSGRKSHPVPERPQMLFVELIRKKRDGKELSR